MLKQEVQGFQERLKKVSHNSHLPPSSDRFGRQPRSLRKRSGNKAGGHIGHQGNTLHLSEMPDKVIIHVVERCAVCQQARVQGRTSLHPLEVQGWKDYYQALLQDGYQANPPDPPQCVGRRGRRK